MLKAQVFTKLRRLSKLFLLGFAVSLFTIFSSPAFAQLSSNRQPGTSANLPLVVVNRFEIKPEQRELFLKLATAALEPTRAEPGCITYGFYEEPTAKNSFIYYEEWKDRTALVEHLNKPYVKPLLGKFPEILKGKTITRVYTTSSVAYELPQAK